MPTATGGVDHYAVLQVSPRADHDIIHAAYRVVAARCQQAGDDAGLRAANAAKEVLLDSANRAAYDDDYHRPHPKGRIIGPYKILEQIGKGGFGKTYKVEHVILGGLACLKQCSEVTEEYTAVLLNEANAMWDLRHYSIPAVRDVIRIDEGGGSYSLGLVSSLMEGIDLRKILQKIRCPMDPETVAWIAQRVMNALKYIHYHGVIHGDLTPQNIMVQPEKHMAGIVDFGLSMIKPTTKDKSIGHTEVFAPPEQLMEMPLRPESDFYALGMTMIFALNGGDIAHTMRLDLPNTVPDPLCAFIKRLIAHDMSNRPHWKEEDLFDTIQRVREQSFGSSSSGMKPIPGL